MKKKIVLYVTDVHGEIQVFERLFKMGAGKNIRALIIGGDIAPFVMFAGESNIELQREFLSSYLIPRITKFFEDTKKPVFIMMGNDDFKINYDLLLKAEEKGIIKLLNQRVHKWKGWTIGGYSYINTTPFFLKDWEKNENEIMEDLEDIWKDMGKNSLIVFHAPPLGTSLDVIFSGEHVGSRSIKEFIEKKQPDITLHGHIHESPDISGNYIENIGKTVSINPGNGKIILIDLDSPRDVLIA